MRYRSIFVFSLLLCPALLSKAQGYDPLHPPCTYRNADNPNYWRNRKPFEGYWQQDVHYNITADVDEKMGIISGKEKLVYWNNSPDDLSIVYFHLYQNAFQPGSYYDKLQDANHANPKYGPYEQKLLGTIVKDIRINGRPVQKIELDNTILKIWLPVPLKAGQNCTFEMNFKTWYDNQGTVRRRMKTFATSQGKHFDGVHWYPRMAVYDRKFGWCTDQHLGHEFYGDFGCYDVQLTFAANYVVGATGFLLNRNEVLPASLMNKLDIRNFSKKPWGSEASIVVPYDSTKRKTWRYHAENVHDFAFTADPTYRIGIYNWRGIRCVALAQEQHAAGWQNAAFYTAQVIKTYSRDIGMYTYHKIIVADARDGMEYPMLTLDGGHDPDYRGLLAHEVGHNWFFGQVGNNETYRALMDEGFTQFLTAWCLRKLEGDTLAAFEPHNFYLRRFVQPELTLYRTAYYAYLDQAVKRRDPVITTHSDGFNGALRHAGGYRQVYYKTATMLFNLEYVLGDSLFLDAMKHYFGQWKIAHPYPEDFRNSIIQYTGVDLNWFFDQWLDTDKHLDYAIKSIRKGKGEDEYLLTFKRKERMQMPIDFTVTNGNGRKYDFYIPNTWWVKETGATVLPRWTGWDKINPEYTADIIVPGGLEQVEIDTSGRLADMYRLDNNSKFQVELNFDHRLNNRPRIDRYEAFVRPDIWWNGYDGFKAGVRVHGAYMNYLHQFDLTIWMNAGMLQYGLDTLPDNHYNKLNYRFHYSTHLDRFVQGTETWLKSMFVDGLSYHAAGIGLRSADNKKRLNFNIASSMRPDNNDLKYLLYPGLWEVAKYNNYLNLGFSTTKRMDYSTIQAECTLRTSLPGSNYNYRWLQAQMLTTHNIGKLRLRTRSIARFGDGSAWAPESMIYLAGASPEEMMDNTFTRSIGFVPSDWVGAYGTTTNHFHYGGGLNLRGYSGYLAPEEYDYQTHVMSYKGTSGMALNTDLDFGALIPWRAGGLNRSFHLSPYFFGDIGVININDVNEPLRFAKARIDAGAGAALTIKKWWVLQKTNPLTLRFDVPFFLNSIPGTDKDFVMYRWLIGVEKAF